MSEGVHQNVFVQNEFATRMEHGVLRWIGVDRKDRAADGFTHSKPYLNHKEARHIPRLTHSFEPVDYCENI